MKSTCLAMLLPFLVWGADERVLVPAHGRAETRLVLTPADMSQSLVLWMQADPNLIDVTVIDPQGKQYTQTTSRDTDAVTVALADRGSRSEDEINLAKFLGSNGTLISFNPKAPAGEYRIQTFGTNLSSATEIILRRTTLEEIEQDQQRQLRERDASVFAAPEQRSPLTNGRAQVNIASQRWDAADVILVGTSLGVKSGVTLLLPDGSQINETTAPRLGCQWEWDETEGATLNFLTVPKPHLGVSCPGHMVEGGISIALDTGQAAKPGQAAAAVFRPKNLEAVFRADLEQLTPSWTAIRLDHRADPDSTPGYMSGVAGRPVQIRVDAVNAEQASALTVTAELFEVDEKKDIGVMVLGRHESKTSLAAPAGVVRASDGSFVYTFTASRPGTFQVDFIAEGQLDHRRRFKAQTGVRVFVRQ